MTEDRTEADATDPAHGEGQTSHEASTLVTTRRHWQWVLFGTALVLVVVVAAALTIDVGAVSADIAATDPVILIAAFGVVTGSLVAWSEAQRTLLRASGAACSIDRSLAIFWISMVPRHLLPIGHAAAMVVLAYLYDREVPESYETIAAPVLIAEVLSLVISSVIAAVGAFLLILDEPTMTVELLAAIVGIGVILFIGLALGYAYRAVLLSHVSQARDHFLRVERRVSGRLGRRVARLRSKHGLARFRAAFAESADRRVLAVSLLLTLAGWIGFAVSLQLSAFALGHPLSFAAGLFIVPVVGYANLLPVPGGLGGYEAALVGLLIWIVGLDPVGAVAVTVVFRLVSFWFVVLVGAGFALLLSVDLRQISAEAVQSRK